MAPGCIILVHNLIKQRIQAHDFHEILESQLGSFEFSLLIEVFKLVFKVVMTTIFLMLFKHIRENL